MRSFRLAYLADVDDFGAVLALKNCLDTHRHLTVGASDKGPLSHHGNGLPSIGAESGENRVAVQEVELLIVRLFLGLLLLDRLLLHWDVHDGGWRDFRYSLQRSSKGLVALAILSQRITVSASLQFAAASRARAASVVLNTDHAAECVSLA